MLAPGWVMSCLSTSRCAEHQQMRQPPWFWKNIFVTQDRGSDDQQAIKYLKWLGCNLEAFAGYNHDHWSDYNDAIGEVHGWDHVWAAAIHHKLCFRPRQSCGHHKSLQSVAQQYCSITEPYQCPFYHHYYDEILKDKGM